VYNEFDPAQPAKPLSAGRWAPKANIPTERRYIVKKRNPFLCLILFFLVSCSNVRISTTQAAIIENANSISSTKEATIIESPTLNNNIDNSLSVCPSIVNDLKTDNWKTYTNYTYKISLKFPPDWRLTDQGEIKVNFRMAGLIDVYSPIDIVTEADEIEGGYFGITVYNKFEGGVKTIAIDSLKWSEGNICKYYHNQITGILTEHQKYTEDWRTLFVQGNSNVISILTIANSLKPDMTKILDQVFLSVTLLD
jgi:hypothetical protein